MGKLTEEKSFKLIRILRKIIVSSSASKVNNLLPDFKREKKKKKREVGSSERHYG
jgi:hypothetical protein